MTVRFNSCCPTCGNQTHLAAKGDVHRGYEVEINWTCYRCLTDYVTRYKRTPTGWRISRQHLKGAKNEGSTKADGKTEKPFIDGEAQSEQEGEAGTCGEDRRADRPDRGACEICGKPVDADPSFCPEHEALRQETLEDLERQHE